MSAELNEEALADQLTERFYTEHGEELAVFGDRGRKHTKQDLMHHLNYLKNAYLLKNEQIFIDYALWLHQVLVTRDVPGEMLTLSFQWIDEELEQYQKNERFDFYQKCLQLAIAELT
ncbi:hypothetical protein [Salipaludibacillus daqingensis]|uniref:hypothetical protein n=1 Tax=Salipaludibacillus daqingensis TaxID=3041001 RepID=UPI002472FD33|nr:hypothetical protein [Salipaludibacillus daqingensis]